MSYVLTFIGGVTIGAVFGVATLCCFIVSGKESKREGKYLNGEQN